MENKKHHMTKEWYEKMTEGVLSKKWNPKISWSEHVKLKAEYLKKRER